MGLWIQTLKPHVEQLEQDVESKSMIIFVWPQCNQDTRCILCSLNVSCSAPIIILIPIMSQLTTVKLTYPTFPHYLNIIFLSMSLSTKWSLFFRCPKCYIHFSPVPCVLHALPSCSPSFDFSNNIWKVLQILELYTVQLCQSTCDFLHCMSKYSSQHAVLKHTWPCAISLL